MKTGIVLIIQHIYAHILFDYNIKLGIKLRNKRELITKSEHLQCNEKQWFWIPESTCRTAAKNTVKKFLENKKRLGPWVCKHLPTWIVPVFPVGGTESYRWELSFGRKINKKCHPLPEYKKPFFKWANNKIHWPTSILNSLIQRVVPGSVSGSSPK